MLKSLWGRLVGDPPPSHAVPVHPPYIPQRCMYDRISERRLLEKERLRLSQQHLPPSGNYCVHSTALQDAWAWLPGCTLDGQACASELVFAGWQKTHDARLVTRHGTRRPLRRLDVGSARRVSVNATERAVELLQATLANCPLLPRMQEWDQTEVHLLTPSGVDELTWFERAIALWPEHHAPGWGFRVSSQPPGQWLHSLLGTPARASNILCVCADSRVNTAMHALAPECEVLGEGVSLIALQRLPPTEQPRLPCNAAPDPDAAPDPMLSLLISRLSAELGPVSAQWVRLALAVLTARAEHDSAQCPLNLTTHASPQGWVIG